MIAFSKRVRLKKKAQTGAMAAKTKRGQKSLWIKDKKTGKKSFGGK